MWTVLQDLGKLNKKGMSAVEVVITFTLVAAISISLLNVVMTYKDREETESIKQEIVTYKNNITCSIFICFNFIYSTKKTS